MQKDQNKDSFQTSFVEQQLANSSKHQTKLLNPFKTVIKL